MIENLASAPAIEMSRRSQTFWICGTLLALGTGALFFATRSDDPCVGLLGNKDLDCAADRASANIMGRPWSYELWQTEKRMRASDGTDDEALEAATSVGNAASEAEEVTFEVEETMESMDEDITIYD